MANCESCGMPMTTDQEHGGGKSQSTRCCYCSHADGTHKTYDEVLAGGIEWIMSENCEQMGFPRATTEREAKARIEANLLQQPAWKGKK